MGQLKPPDWAKSECQNHRLLAGGAATVLRRRQSKRGAISALIGNTDRLVRLVNDILDLERIGSGKAELHYAMCSVDELLRRAASLLQGEASKARIRFDFAANEVKAWADSDRILQDLTNLISNAIKFSPEGSQIKLSARLIGDGEEAEIEVRDQGEASGGHAGTDL